MQRRERVIIEDVLADPDFEPHREIAASAGFRAVQSTPLFQPQWRTAGHDIHTLPSTPPAFGT